jgi:2-dehydro-3-deoxyphosphogluconate aldolase/(4S)-4-hydroxy-2-oxoglutarate aldolase
MARHSRMEVLNCIFEQGLVPIFYNPSLEVARKILGACVAGGSRIVEFTNRGDFAFKVFSELSEYVAQEGIDVILGVGSIVDAPTASLYIAAGTDFVVSPILNEEVARLCNKRKVPYMPGCGSASEISQAEELGVEIVKIFPGDSVGGPKFAKAILGPCPWTRIMPTGGVDITRESIRAWFDAGAACVGIGSKLLSKDLVQAGDFEGISRRVSQTLALIREIRTPSP